MGLRDLRGVAASALPGYRRTCDMSTYIPLALDQAELTGAVRVPFVPPNGGEKFPEPVFPQKPQFLTDAALPGDGERHWTPAQIWHTFHGWAIPYFKSRLL